MIKILISLTLFSLLITSSISSEFSYEGYHLVRLYPTNTDHSVKIAAWEENPEFDIWNSKVKNTNVDVLLSPLAYLKYKKLFNEISLTYTVLDKNIQDKINNQKRSMARSKRSSSIVGKFPRYTEIMSYIDQVVGENPTLASSYVAGSTYERRLLKTIVLKTPSSTRSIFIDCGIHAREWIAVSTCIWIIDSLLNEFKANDPTIVKILSKYEIHILPLINPDGYEYSHNTVRLWRKNRTPNKGSSCVGTDLNRNFGFKWLTGGSSTNKCSDTYAGSSADSELETQALESAILKKLGNWDSYLSIHTYGNWWFTPWSYTATLPTDYADLEAKAKIGAAGVRALYGTEYEIGSSAALLYINSGPSDDWARGNASIKYSYTLEAAPGQSGTDSSFGFMLPEDRAPNVGREVYNGIKVYLNSFF